VRKGTLKVGNYEKWGEVMAFHLNLEINKTVNTVNNYYQTNDRRYHKAAVEIKYQCGYASYR
jgi:hypothetical protein